MSRASNSILRSRNFQILSITAAAAISALAHAAQLRVGPGMQYSTIQMAIDAAANGDEVLVEPGTYSESLDLKGMAITLRGRTGMLNTYVTAAGGGATIVTCSNAETVSTVVEGFTFMNANGAPGIRIAGASPTFRTCSVQNCQISNASGAALQVSGSSSPIFETCYFQGNRTTNGSGGAAALTGGLTTFTECSFQANEVAGYGPGQNRGGGAIYAAGGRAKATGTNFTNNAVRVTAGDCCGDVWSRGGTICIEGSSSEFTNCTFSSSFAYTSGNYSTSRSYGGAIFDASSNSTYRLCTFNGPTAESGGYAGRHARGGTFYFAGNSQPLVDTCTVNTTRADTLGGFAFLEGGVAGTFKQTTINGSSSSTGGAMYLANSAAPTISDCRFNNCSAFGEGGAWYSEGVGVGAPAPIILRTTFNSCSAPIGGALRVNDNSNLVIDSCRFTSCTATNQGGAIFTWYAPITIRNTAFDRNTCTNGSAIRTNGDTNRFPYLGGCFFCGNSGEQANWINGSWFDSPPYNTNQFLAQCSTDCNNNGIWDDAEITAGVALDCNHNGIPDSCDIAGGIGTDCNSNGVLDACDIAAGTAADCDHNGLPDSCQPDCDQDGIPNACEIAAGAADCNGNMIPDSCDIASGTSLDSNKDGVPDSCQHIEYLGLSSEYVPVAGTSADPNMPSTAVCVRIYANFSQAGADLLGVYGNASNPLTISVPGGGFFQAIGGGNVTSDVLCIPEVPSPSFKYDSWLTIGRSCMDANVLQVFGFNFGPFVTGNGFTDNDCVYFVTPGSSQAYAGPTKRLLIAQLTTRTGVFPTFRANLVGRNADGTDWSAYSQLAPLPVLVDCNSNGAHDVLDVATGGAWDCNDNGLPDQCEVPNFGADCNNNGTPDSCDILAGTSQDLDNTGVPDECECVGDVNRDGRVNVDDIIAVIIGWGDGPMSPADLNRDGIVNALDLALVLGGYGECQ